jgi:hypothetical protein
VTSPADQTPPDPERGHAVRLMIAGALIAAAGVLGVVASALAGPHVHLGAVPVAVAAGLAGACLGAAFVVLAGKGKRP